MAPIEREIRRLANGLTAVKDEQEYIVIRERTHRNTAESTNTRVKWWSILQALVLFLVVAWQVYYLKVCLFFIVARRTVSNFHSVILRGEACLLGNLDVCHTSSALIYTTDNHHLCILSYDLRELAVLLLEHVPPCLQQ